MAGGRLVANLRGVTARAEHRGPGGRIVGMMSPGDASIINDVTPIRGRIRAKANAYGDLDAPFVIAIDTGGEFVADGNFVSALYGTSAVAYMESAGRGAPELAAVRLPDGLLHGPEGPRRVQVSAVLTTTLLTPWTVTSTIPTWWANPGARHSLAAPAPLLRRAVLNGDRHEIEYTAAETETYTFFDLPANWPGPK